jgi:putative restriction endonuclease
MPWKASDPKTKRTKPSNWLLLNALHDKAFDLGYITIDTDFRIVVSSRPTEGSPSAICKDWLFFLKGQQIMLPDKFIPEQEFIQYHSDVVFIRLIEA